MGAAVDTNPVSVIAAAHLTQDELEYLRATKLLGVRPRDVPEFLRWTHAKTERVRSRLSKRLMRIRQEPAPDLPVRAEPDVGRGSSLHTTFIDRLGSGRKIYALTGSKRVGFPDLSLVERQSSRTGAPMAEDLQVTLHDERARFDKAVVNLNPA